MKKYFIGIISFLGLLSSCSDGDITIQRIEFTGTEAYSCTADISTNFLYKIQDRQALILTFTSGMLKNEEGTVTGSIPTNFKLYYRIFDVAPTRTYFCSMPPPSSPRVTSEIEAQGGSVEITTQAVEDTQNNTTRYTHIIRIKDLLITNADGERLIESNFNFGTYQTTE
ncbi:MAG: hypothetical protein Q3983_05765 [Capnocytophaga sp.]|nr:hypothetical protein [Capnocytophaga sp.]